MITNLIIFSLIVFGVSNALVNTDAFNFLQRFKLFHCISCTAFWVGILVWIVYPVTGSVILDAFIASGTATLYQRMV